MTLHSHEKDELMYLRYFYSRASDSMGPADDDIYRMIKEEWLEDGRELPEGYEIEEEEEEDG